MQFKPISRFWEHIADGVHCVGKLSEMFNRAEVVFVELFDMIFGQ